MKELTLSPDLTAEVAEIYEAMVTDYDQVAQQIPLTCAGCPDNCCDSYFLHYTYTEWAYLWQGMRAADKGLQKRITRRAHDYVKQSKPLLAQKIRPQLMCPLNEEGLCTLYKHRLMVCRTHGVPARLTRPDGQPMNFPGCFRCQDIVEEKYPEQSDQENLPRVDRTPLFQRMAALEAKLLSNKRHLFPKVRMTIADMIVQGPPQMIESCIL